MRVIAVLALVSCGTPSPGSPVSEPPEAPPADVPIEPSEPDDGHVHIRPDPATFALPNPCEPLEWCDQAPEVGLTELSKLYGRGTAWVDVDNDGWEDLWLSHDRFWLKGWDRTSSLFRNLGNGAFQLFDLGISGIHTMSNWSGAWGDYDNDGDADLYLANGGYSGTYADHLYRNDLSTTGTFTEVSLAAGIEETARNTWGASWADVDRDGFLDLVVTHRSLAQDAPCCPAGSGDFHADEYTPVLLYMNQGNGTFVDRGFEMGLRSVLLDGKNPVWLDVDRDGWLDLFIANAGATAGAQEAVSYEFGSAGQVALYRNEEGKRFTNITSAAIADPEMHDPVFSAAVLDYDQDGWDDLYLGRAFEADKVLVNQQDGTFAVASAGLDMTPGFEAHQNTMGLGVGDVTGDGFPEVFVGTGWPNFQGFPLMYRHRGAELGYERMQTAELGRLREESNHGAAFTDFDHDGDVDMAWNLGAFSIWDLYTDDEHRAHPALYVNHAPQEHVTTAIRLVGTTSNRDALGARIEVRGSEVRHYALLGMNGFQSWNGPWTTVSLGDAAEADLVITWPTGVSETVHVPGGARVTITEP